MAMEQEIRRRAVKFLADLKNSSVAVFFHDDGDGICSACVMKRFAEREEVEASFTSIAMPPSSEQKRHIVTTPSSRFVLLDLGMDQFPSVIRSLEKKGKVLIIDHHKVHNNMNSENVIHYNPLLWKENVYLAASLLTYELCNEITDLNDCAWIAAIGVISDCNVKDARFFLSKVKEMYPGFLKDVENPFDSKFGKLVQYISAVRSHGISCETIMERLSKFSSPHEMLHDDWFKSYFTRFLVEMENEIENARSKSLKFGSFLFHELKSRLRIRSELATRLSFLFPDKIVFVYKVSNDMAKISVRTQRDIDLYSFLKDVLSNFSFKNFGGHKRACAIEMSMNEFQRFIEYLKSLRLP